MSQLMLQFVNMHACFKLMSCIGVTQRMDTTDFLDAGLSFGGGENTLH